MDDIDKHKVTEIYCLGDIVGYGPNPRECIDLVRKCKIVLLGNHDQGAMFDPDGFNPPAERAIFGHAPNSNPLRKTAPACRSAGTSSPSARACTKKTASSMSTARPAIRSTNTSF